MALRATPFLESIVGEIQRVRNLIHQRMIQQHRQQTEIQEETHAYLIPPAERSREIRREWIALPAGRTGVGAVGIGVRPEIGIGAVLLPVDQCGGRVTGVVPGGEAEVPHSAVGC